MCNGDPILWLLRYRAKTTQTAGPSDAESATVFLNKSRKSGDAHKLRSAQRRGRERRLSHSVRGCGATKSHRQRVGCAQTPASSMPDGSQERTATMKTKLLALMLLAGGSKFEQT
jgi:hypothetical protein